MQHQHADFRDAMRAKLGQALREQHDLTEPLPKGLVELLGQLDASVRARNSTQARLYAEVDECVAAMVSAANKKPGKPHEI
jgi:hypothetical protein